MNSALNVLCIYSVVLLQYVVLLLGRKVMNSIFKSRDVTLPTKVRLVKAMVFPVVMYGCESWTVKKAEYLYISLTYASIYSGNLFTDVNIKTSGIEHNLNYVQRWNNLKYTRYIYEQYL